MGEADRQRTIIGTDIPSSQYRDECQPAAHFPGVEHRSLLRVSDTEST